MLTEDRGRWKLGEEWQSGRKKGRERTTTCSSTEAIHWNEKCVYKSRASDFTESVIYNVLSVIIYTPPHRTHFRRKAGKVAETS